MLSWQIEQLQEVAQQHHDWIGEIEDRPHLPEFLGEAIPWGRIIAILGLLALFAAGVLSRQEAKELGLRLFGVLFGS